MNTTQSTDTKATIAKLTDKGRAAMTAVGMIAYGQRQLSFFDDGIRAGSGSWGECLTGELGHRSAGVINQLAKLGLFDVTPPSYPDGAWFALTELGVAVALTLAGAEALPVEDDEQDQPAAPTGDAALADLPRDLDGDPYRVEDDGTAWKMCRCCGAYATGTQDGIACRVCFQPTWNDGPARLPEPEPADGLARSVCCRPSDMHRPAGSSEPFRCDNCGTPDQDERGTVVIDGRYRAAKRSADGTVQTLSFDRWTPVQIPAVALTFRAEGRTRRLTSAREADQHH